MAALWIGRELHLVDGEKIDVRLARHGLHGAHVVARPLGLDLLFASDQGHGVRADPRDDLVVDLACQQAQRQADEPRLVAQHALDRQVRLARIGRPEHGRHIADAMLDIAAHSTSSLSVVGGEASQSRYGKIKGPCPIRLPGQRAPGRRMFQRQRTGRQLPKWVKPRAPAQSAGGSVRTCMLNAAGRSEACREFRSPRAWRRAWRTRPGWEL